MLVLFARHPSVSTISRRQSPPAEYQFNDLGDYHPSIYSCIPCEAHGKVVRKNNHRARQSGTFGSSENNFSSVLNTDNIYIALTAGGKDPY